MGVYVSVSRWGKDKPVLNVIRINGDNGIELTMPIEDFIFQVAQEVGYGIITTVTPTGLEAKVKQASEKVIRKIKDQTTSVAHLAN